MTLLQEEVPVIDLSQKDRSSLISQIANACSTFGFFQVTNHGIDPSVIEEFHKEGVDFFVAGRNYARRNEHNARGYFDDELTKQRRDWKKALDVGVPGSKDWTIPDDDPRNACLDGLNQFPNDNPQFRRVVVKYFQECERLADQLARFMAQGVVGSSKENEANNEEDDTIIEDLKSDHTSYLRLNYYPSCTKENELGISPHRDAGFLTILLQDDNCHSLQVWFKDAWHSVSPVPGALTINTGDMAQIWSNGRYLAPLHRVLTNSTTPRFSAPFFYNPPYHTYVKPVVGTSLKYHPCLWGYFRALRFAGDLTDLGIEIQVEDYDVSSDSTHRKRQEWISQYLQWNRAFSVENVRKLFDAESAQASCLEH